MHEHLQALVLPQVVVEVLIDGLRLALTEVVNGEAERLLVVLDELWLVRVGSTTDTRRQRVGHGLAVGVLLNVDGTHLHRSRLGTGSRLQALPILPPLAAHQVEAAEAEHDGVLETGHEHTHEADAGEVADATHTLFVLRQGDAELIPAYGGRVTIAQLHPTVAAVGDVGVGGSTVIIGLQFVVADADMILEVALVLIEREVLVDILHVGSRLIRGVIRLRPVLRVGRVSLGVVDALVAVQDAGAGLVEVGAAVVVVVIASRVITPSLNQRVVRDDGTYLVEPFLVGSVGSLLVVVKTVESHVLQGTAAAGRGKGVRLRGLFGNLSPLGIAVVRGTVDGHTTLVELLTVAQDILAHLAQIDEEVAGIL